MNIVSITGRLTKEVELRRTQSGKCVVTYSLAVKRPRARDEVDFVNVVTWEKGAEYLHQYSHKGDVVAVSGSLQSRKWKDKNDNNRTEWEVVTDSVEILSGKKEESNQGYNSNSYAIRVNQPAPAQDFHQIDISDEQLPF